MGNKLLMPFDTDDPQFVRGFELGQLWELLSLRPERHTATLHDTNEGMVYVTAEFFKCDVKVTPLGSGWIEARFNASSYQPSDSVLEANFVQ